jgi:predicted MFS family arabinose efflux permease
LVLLAVTCGVAVGNVYFPQAISPLVASDLRISVTTAAEVITATQFGYTAGIFLLVPLGDRLSHRPLIVCLLGLTGLGLVAAGLAPNIGLLILAAACLGTSTVVAPLIAVFTVSLVAEDRRGIATGALLSGSIGGILLARTFGGIVGQQYGWRAPYLVAATLTLVLATLLTFVLPTTAPRPAERCLTLLTQPFRLLRTEPDLRRSSFYQASIFAGFSAVWTALALLLTGPTYGFGAQAAGLIALVSAVTMFCAPLVGARIDRDGPDPVNLASMLATLAAAAVLACGGLGGVGGFLALVLGVLVLDVAMQSGMIANQVRIFMLRPEAYSQFTTAYMSCAYLGGSAGSWLGAQAYGRHGWIGPCALVAALAAAALSMHLRGSAVRANHPGSAGVDWQVKR